MISTFSNLVLFLAAAGSGSWGLIILVALLLLCCGGMLFGMRGMGSRQGRADKTDEQSDRTKDDQRKSA